MIARCSLALVVMLGAACGKDSEPTAKQTADEPAAPGPAPETADPAAPAEPSAQQPPRPPGAPRAATATTTRDLESIGYRIDAPESWTLRQVNELAYAFRIPADRAGGVAIMSQLAISKRPTPPAALADMVKECAGTVVDRSEGEPLYYVCEQTAAGQTIRNLEYVVEADGGALYCSGSGLTIEPLLEACKSLAPQ
jgi:hypothetical protein